MKTAVSLPDPLFRAGERLAQRLGLSRSHLYAEALRQYVDRHEDEADVTRRLNEVYAAAPAEIDPSVAHLAALGLAQRLMEVARGDVWWADLPDPEDSSPAGSRPVLIIQSGSFNRSRLQTVITAVITSNLARIDEGLRLALAL